MHRLVFAALALMICASSARAQEATAVGVWQDDSDRTQVEIYPCGDRLCGRIVWFKWPNDAQGLPLVDLKNPDKALRSRPLLGLVVLRGLRPRKDHLWTDGKIYNPLDGFDYQASVVLQADGKLRLRTYILLPLLGKNRIWTRVR